jgi:hypothetical protein
MIEITHAKTGEFKTLPGKQEVADFLAGRDDADQWTGHERYGALPDPTPQEAAAAPVTLDSPEPEVPGELAEPVEAPAPPAAKKAKGRK